MASSISYIMGVSYPRSGHHLLERVLREYFGPEFGYCEFYTPKKSECCKKFPCIRQGKINFTKHHDGRNIVPILENQIYLIQYRSYLPALVSNYELDSRHRGEDNEALFRKFAEAQKQHYMRFLGRWCDASASGSTFIRVSYERLTSSPVETFSELIRQFQPGIDVDEDRLGLIIKNLDRHSVEKSADTQSKKAGVASFRNISTFRYYNEEFFKALDRDTCAVF